jgi:hypothetical protein
VSRERINAAMHAICASLAAAAATGMGAGTPHPGSLDEATLHHAALSTPVARSAPGGGLDAATLGAVLRAVANKRVGDLVIRGFEDSQRPGVLRFSLHDLGGVQSPDSAEAAEAADALIAVARTASEEAGPGAVAPGAAAAGTEAAGTLRPGARAQRAAAVKRHYANMAAGTQDSLLCLSLIQADQTASVACQRASPTSAATGAPSAAAARPAGAWRLRLAAAPLPLRTAAKARLRLFPLRWATCSSSSRTSAMSWRSRTQTWRESWRQRGAMCVRRRLRLTAWLLTWLRCAACLARMAAMRTMRRR